MYRYVMGSGGGVSNLLLGSEELGSTGVGRWNQDLMNAVNSDQVNNPEGTEQTADQLDFQASKSAKIRQDVTLVAGTEYTFSVWARAASGTQPFRLRYYDNVGVVGVLQRSQLRLLGAQRQGVTLSLSRLQIAARLL